MSFYYTLLREVFFGKLSEILMILDKNEARWKNFFVETFK